MPIRTQIFYAPGLLILDSWYISIMYFYYLPNAKHKKRVPDGEVGLGYWGLVDSVDWGLVDWETRLTGDSLTGRLG